MRIKRKLVVAFTIVITLFLGEIVLNQLISQQVQSTYQALKEEVEPAVKTIDRFKVINRELNLLAISQLYHQENNNRVTGILDVELPNLKKEIFLLQEDLPVDNPIVEQAISVITITDKIIKLNKKVAAILSKSYFNKNVDKEELLKQIVEVELADLSFQLEAKLGNFQVYFEKQFDTQQKELNSDLNLFSTIILLTGGIGIVIGIVITVQVVNSISTPINSLLVAVEDFGQGKFNSSLNIASNDEIGELGNAFNRLGKSLEDSFQKIEQQNENFRQLELQFRSIMEGSPNAIFLINGERNISLVNEQGINYFGYAKSELLGGKAEVLFPTEARDFYVEFIDSFFKNNRYFENDDTKEFEGRRKDGSIFKVKIDLTPVLINGETLALTTVTDITASKKAEEKLRLYNKELKAANQDLEQFAYIATHDIKVPITNIDNYLNFLKQDKDISNERSLFAIDWIDKSVKKANQTVLDLVMVTKTRNESDIEVIDIDLEEIIDDFLADFHAEIQASKALITVDFKHEPIIRYNLIKAKSLLQNLISNALKYKAADVAPVIHLKTERFKEFICLSISDNGLGIDLKKDEHKVFGLFKRAHSKIPGSGLGLYMTKQSIENMGGKIEVESEVGKGTTFRVYFKV